MVLLRQKLSAPLNSIFHYLHFVLSYMHWNSLVTENYTRLHAQAIKVLAGLSKVFYDIIFLLKVIYCISYLHVACKLVLQCKWHCGYCGFCSQEWDSFALRTYNDVTSSSIQACIGSSKEVIQVLTFNHNIN